MGLKGTLSDTEDISSVTADDLANCAAAIAGLSHDFLYWNAIGGQLGDRRIHVLTPQIAVILQS
ncbi:hypothetical protein AB9E30_36280, partial [Rhizobium leguminosarum]